MKSHRMWMRISGFFGLLTFFIANFTALNNFNIICGCVQIIVNIFVFVCWLKAYKNERRFIKFIAFWGVVIPPIMAIFTFINILLPAILK